jgi:vacuolar-type H+-ATPase subunit C/Vma6
MTSVVIRSHALIADLLTAEQMHELANSGSVEAFTTRISETLYGTVTLDSDGDPSIAFEKEFYVKFIERMTKIVDITPKKIGTFLQAYYFLRFEVLNLKRILRGKFSEQSVPNIMELLVPMTPYQVSDYRKLVEAETLQETVGLLKETPYSSLESSLPFVEEYVALWPLELALNSIYADTVLESLEKLSKKDRTLIRNILKFEVDVENLLNAVKHQRSRKEGEALDLKELFPVLFDISLDQIEAIVTSENLRDVVQNLGEPYADILSPIYEGDVALIRTKVRRHIYTIVENGRAVNDFGLNVVMAYLIFSELEKDDLVGIAWGITQGISPEDLTKYLSVSKSH